MEVLPHAYLEHRNELNDITMALGSRLKWVDRQLIPQKL